jgi:glutathione S-transferase
MAAARVEIVRHLDILEQALTGHDFLVDDVFTLAEVAYLPFLDLLPMLEVVPPPAVAAWTARLLARPSAAATAHE